MSQFTGSDSHNLIESSIDYSTIFAGIHKDDPQTYVHPDHGVPSLTEEDK